MSIDHWYCYEKMLFSRRFEESVSQLWKSGRISGEMHLSTGEEAITAGTVLQLQEGDAMALDHRGTSAMLMRGVDPFRLMREFMGCSDGLCGGQGGHMHLFSKPHLAASSGIVGASGPAAVGFALANRHLRPGRIALAFFGDGAINQGMLMESMNLAVAWKLPVIFICKDSQWAITTVSATLTGGSIAGRAAAFSMPSISVDGNDVEAIWNAAEKKINRARKGKGPAFIHATCTHPDGHFLGDPLLRLTRHPVREVKKVAGPMIKSATRVHGASVFKRSGSFASLTALIGKTARQQHFPSRDPLKILRKRLRKNHERLEGLEAQIGGAIDDVCSRASATSNQQTPEEITS
jgi:TPP-dependent pyruvate/acetoin dehydrogenase alpha subunit